MDPQSSPISSKNWRRLLIALIISGSLNVGVLGLWIYCLAYDLPPKPYCDLQPATDDSKLIPLADHRDCAEVITQMQKLPFYRLIDCLQHTQVIENGFTERDLALSCLIAFHHFDLKRALTNESSLKEKRVFDWKHLASGKKILLTLYPGLSNDQFEAILHFAKNERWPITSERIYELLLLQGKEVNLDPSLVEAFMITPEFWTIHLLFQRVEPPIRKQQILEILLEGGWQLLQKSVDQQRQVNDVSAPRRQKFLLDYIKEGSETASVVLLTTDWEFATKKLEDSQVINLIQTLNQKTPNSEKYVKEMLMSPRSMGVWQQASLRLYEYAGEPIPANWNYESTLARFIPELIERQAGKTKKVDQAPKQIATASKDIAKIIPSKKESLEDRKKTAKTAKSSPSYRHYIVQEGDSLWKISRRFGVDMEVLRTYNQLQSSSIKPGTVLKIP